MPSETRQILFDEAEVMDALRFYSKVSAGRIPPGDIEGCTFSKGPDIEALLHVRDLDGKGESQARFTTSELAAALITYCRAARIPVPKRATKSLKIVEDMLAISFRLDEAASAAPAQHAASG